MKKIASVITAIAAVAAVSVSASAYDMDVDLGFGWSANTTIPGSEFESLTTSSTITIKFETNPDVMDSYWCIKPMINDSGWPFISTATGATLTEAGDAFALDVDDTSVSFTIPDDETVEHVKVAGIAIMGHGITLKEMTVEGGAAAPADSTPEASTPEESAPEASTPEESAPEASTPEAKPPVDTGAAGVAGVLGVAVVAAGAVLVSRKRK